MGEPWLRKISELFEEMSIKHVVWVTLTEARAWQIVSVSKSSTIGLSDLCIFKRWSSWHYCMDRNPAQVVLMTHY